MAGRPKRVPSYCKHKASGQAVVRIGDKDHYLGVYGTPESHERYRRIIAEHFVNGQSSKITELVTCSRGSAVGGFADGVLTDDEFDNEGA